MAQVNIKPKDVKVKDNIVYYLEKPQFIIEDRLLNEIYIKDLETKELMISLVIRKAPNPQGPTQSNPDGMDSYYEFTYMKTNAKCDYVPPGIGLKSVARDLMNYGVLVDGKVNEDNLNKFISIKGSPYTNRNNQTIIIR